MNISASVNVVILTYGVYPYQFRYGKIKDDLNYYIVDNKLNSTLTDSSFERFGNVNYIHSGKEQDVKGAIEGFMQEYGVSSFFFIEADNVIFSYKRLFEYLNLAVQSSHVIAPTKLALFGIIPMWSGRPSVDSTFYDNRIFNSKYWKKIPYNLLSIDSILYYGFTKINIVPFVIAIRRRRGFTLGANSPNKISGRLRRLMVLYCLNQISFDQYSKKRRIFLKQHKILRNRNCKNYLSRIIVKYWVKSYLLVPIHFLNFLRLLINLCLINFRNVFVK